VTALGRQRDDLIDDVMNGRIAPADAEAEAVRLGLAPLAANPDPQKFDPFSEGWWTLAMSVAWIAWRGRDALLEFYDPYRLECWGWRFQRWQRPGGPIIEGHFLEQLSPATLSRVSLAEAYSAAQSSPPEKMFRVAEARTALLKALQSGRLVATGVATDDGRRKVIPDYEWNDLKLVEESGRDVVRYDLVRRHGYDDVRIRGNEVVVVWPEKSDSVRTGAPGRPSSMHLVVSEHERRLAEGIASVAVMAESEHLAAWLKQTYPDAPPLTPKTIRNKIAAVHRRRKLG
jgi:hypothetical protein